MMTRQEAALHSLNQTIELCHELIRCLDDCDRVDNADAAAALMNAAELVVTAKRRMYDALDTLQGGQFVTK